jgi:hypothetical protein
MTENIIFNAQTLFEEIVEKGIAEGVSDKDAFAQHIENILDGHAMWGEIHDDQDQEGITETMKARWPEYEAELNKRAI